VAAVAKDPYTKEAYMEDIEKLAHLIEHWMEHNAEHVKTYLHWAGVAGAAGKPELAGILRKIAEENRKMEGLLNRAREALG
jgi:rubrerythrin